MTQYIPFEDTGYFSKFITDYLAQKEPLKCLYHRFPLTTNFLEQIKEKGAQNSSFSSTQGAISKSIHI